MRGGLRPTKVLTTLFALFPTGKSARYTSSLAFIANRNFLSSVPFIRADDTCRLTGNIQKEQRGLAMSANDELAKAQGAAPEEDTIFDKIVRGDIPCKEVYSDDKVLAFRDVNPVAPVHILVIPKNRDGMSQLSKAREDQKELLGHMMYVAQELGAKECPGGFRLVINDGKDGAQSVYHLHVHIMGGRPMKWPPG